MVRNWYGLPEQRLLLYGWLALYAFSPKHKLLAGSRSLILPDPVKHTHLDKVPPHSTYPVRRTEPTLHECNDEFHIRKDSRYRVPVRAQNYTGGTGTVIAGARFAFLATREDSAS